MPLGEEPVEHDLPGGKDLLRAGDDVFGREKEAVAIITELGSVDQPDTFGSIPIIRSTSGGIWNFFIIKM